MLVLSCCAGVGMALVANGESHGSGTSETLIAPASEEGANAIKTFTFDEGLKCELWAGFWHKFTWF